ncbi:MAG TPA: chain length determinant protein EpsF [Burkholderiales bacterium]
MNVQQFLIILKARFPLFIAALMFTVCGTVVVSLLLPKSYTAAASVVVDIKGGDLMNTNGINLPVQMAPGQMATQLDIMTSQKVALKVVDKLRIAESPVAKRRFQEANKGRGSIRHYYADLLLKKLDVKPSRESTVVTISFSGTEAGFAAAVANAFAESYIETTLEMKVAPSRQNAVWFGDQLKSLRGDLEKAQRKLSEYQQANGIVNVDERLDVESSKLSELSSQLVSAQGQGFDNHGRASQVNASLKSGDPGDLPEVVGNPLIQNLRGEAARAEARLKDTSSQRGENDPQYIRDAAELSTLRSKLDSEMKNVANSVISAQRANQQRESEARAAVAAQKEKVLEIKRQRDEMAVLIREVESAQRIFDIALQRFGQTSLEGQATLANATLLNPAVEPATQSSPRMVLNVSLSIILGTLIGLGIAMLAELADRRVRTVDDLGGDTSLPVIGVIGPSPRSRPARRPRLLGLFPARPQLA